MTDNSNGVMGLSHTWRDVVVMAHAEIHALNAPQRPVMQRGFVAELRFQPVGHVLGPAGRPLYGPLPPGDAAPDSRHFERAPCT